LRGWAVERADKEHGDKEISAGFQFFLHFQFFSIAPSGRMAGCMMPSSPTIAMTLMLKRELAARRQDGTIVPEVEVEQEAHLVGHQASSHRCP
jgi:hypothetical protein